METRQGAAEESGTLTQQVASRDGIPGAVKRSRRPLRTVPLVPLEETPKLAQVKASATLSDAKASTSEWVPLPEIFPKVYDSSAEWTMPVVHRNVDEVETVEMPTTGSMRKLETGKVGAKITTRLTNIGDLPQDKRRAESRISSPLASREIVVPVKSRRRTRNLDTLAPIPAGRDARVAPVALAPLPITTPLVAPYDQLLPQGQERKRHDTTFLVLLEMLVVGVIGILVFEYVLTAL